MRCCGPHRVGHHSAFVESHGAMKSFFVHGALAVSLCLNVWFSRRVRYLEKDLLGWQMLLPGDTVPQISVKAQTGEHRVVDWKRPTLFYYFDPSCVWCKRNAPAFLALKDHLKGKADVIAYTGSTEGLNECQSLYCPDDGVVTDGDEDIRRVMKLGGTPQTLWVESGGRVAENWPGSYVGKNRSAIEKRFGITLPGGDGTPER